MFVWTILFAVARADIVFLYILRLRRIVWLEEAGTLRSTVQHTSTICVLINFCFWIVKTVLFLYLFFLFCVLKIGFENRLYLLNGFKKNQIEKFFVMNEILFCSGFQVDDLNFENVNMFLLLFDWISVYYVTLFHREKKCYVKNLEVNTKSTCCWYFLFSLKWRDLNFI